MAHAPLPLRTRSRPAGGAPRRSPIERAAAAAARPDRLRQVGAPVPKHGGHPQSVPGRYLPIRSASDKRRVYLDTGRMGAEQLSAGVTVHRWAEACQVIALDVVLNVGHGPGHDSRAIIVNHRLRSHPLLPAVHQGRERVEQVGAGHPPGDMHPHHQPGHANGAGRRRSVQPSYRQGEHGARTARGVHPIDQRRRPVAGRRPSGQRAGIER